MLRSFDKWLPGYLASVLRRPRRVHGTRHLMFCIADHFEPFRRLAGPDGGARNATMEEARGLVGEWVRRYPACAGEFRDADGLPPSHTFFYPQEEYDGECLNLLGVLCKARLGEVEVHLHHRNDTPDGLRSKLLSFRDTLRLKHGMLGTWNAGRETLNAECDALDVKRNVPPRQLNNQTTRQPNNSHPRIAYGFVHGNWSLCNSRPDGDWCGVNEELAILGCTGCYADFTFPSAPSPTQPRMVNSIYRAKDKPGRPRGCDRGERVRAEGGSLKPEFRKAEGQPLSSVPSSGTQLSALSPQPSLVLIQGPLGLRWGDRKWGLIPRLENGEISSASQPSPGRVDTWVRQGIHVAGRPEWVFVKVHTHGCVEANREVLLGPAMRNMRQYMHSRYNDGATWGLHYVSAREMYNIARAAEDGMAGNPGDYRDYEVAPPPVMEGRK